MANHIKGNSRRQYMELFLTLSICASRAQSMVAPTSDVFETEAPSLAEILVMPSSEEIKSNLVRNHQKYPDIYAIGTGGNFDGMSESNIAIIREMEIHIIELDEDEKCKTDKECKEYPYEVCGIKKDGYCGHKKVFPPTWLEVAGLVTFSLVMALCVVAGIGGGGIAVSLIIAFFHFTTKPAVALSSFSILINSIMRYFYNWKTKNPSKPGQVLIDYSLATVMSPTTLAGS